MTIAHHRNNRSHAYTLMEVLVSVGLMVLVVGALYAGMVQTVQVSDSTREDLRATQIMVEKLEALRLYTWNQIGAAFDPDDPEDWTDPFDSEDPHTTADEADPFVLPATFTAPFTPGSTNANELIYFGTIVLTNSPLTESYASQVLVAKVSVTWTNTTKRVQQREMQTYFAKYGIQNNIPR